MNMDVINLKKDEYLVHKGDDLKALFVVLKGSMRLKTEYIELPMECGSVFGMTVDKGNCYVCDYIAAEPTMIAAYKYETTQDLEDLFAEQPKYAAAFLHAIIVQGRAEFDLYREVEKSGRMISDFVTKQCSQYEQECSKASLEEKSVAVAELQQMSLPEPIPKWETDYFEEVLNAEDMSVKAFFGYFPKRSIGLMKQVTEFGYRILVNMDAWKEYQAKAAEYLIAEEEDLLELWYDLSMKLALQGTDILIPQVRVRELQEFLTQTNLFSEEEIENRMRYYNGMDFKSYALTHAAKADAEGNLSGEVAEVMTRDTILRTDFTKYIMKYAGFEQADIDRCKELLKAYETVAVAADNTTSECQKVRKELTKLFYDIYEKAFLRAVKARSISPVMELFFQFGVLDLQMAGEEHLDELLQAVETINNQLKEQKSTRVYSAYQWLSMVYRGEREPSKNEFDIDYAGELMEQRKLKQITREEENVLKRDQLKKLQFEIRNMFITNNRTTYGRITSFCPVLHEKDFVRTVDQMLLTAERLNTAMNEIRALDYSCFYREVFFMAPEYGIERTEIMKEVLPEIILMPNIGQRAMMWQETSGVKRDTPARFILPIMTIADPHQMLLETVGRYRWEICRKILGVRWNDIREKSLTSEFYDYLQFYRKNHDLTQVAKDKVKADLLHAKNNFREVFVMDYVGWMKYEAQGNFRLNKVSRKIIADYVPFTAEVRGKLVENPMYRELFNKRDILARRKWEKEKMLFDRYTASGGQMTPELEAHMAFYNR